MTRQALNSKNYHIVIYFSYAFLKSLKKTIYHHRSGPPYRIEISNTSDISMVKVNVDNTPLILDATSPYSAEAVVDHYLNGDELNRFDFQVFSSFSSLPFPNNPSHPNYKSYT
ncbi:MAG: hypothetical protein IV090_24270 [Candidatus Sericytochromatia bacterium]|nr:hypothetical protein [Candidatus Sericytochromatia bacterium]